MRDGKLGKAAEVILLLALITAILYLGPGSASNHRITHDFPTGYGASDSYQHEARTEAIEEMGQYRNEASYMMVGLTDVIGFYPPVLYHVSVLLSDLTGMASYDALFLIIGLGLALGAVAAYYLAKSLGTPVALLSIPLMLLITTGKPFLGMVTFGQMPFAFSSLFLVATAWAISKLSLKKSSIPIAIFAAGTIMSHTSESVFMFIFLLVTFAAVALANLIAHRLAGIKKVLVENKNIIIGMVLALAAAVYFVPMFIGIWLKMQPYHFNVETVSASFPNATVFIGDFKFMLALILVGIVFLAIFAAQKRRELGNFFSDPKLFTLFFSFFMMLAGLGTYVGFGLRSFQTRLFWPITLAPLAGFGAYQLIRLVLNMIYKKANMIIVAAVVMIILSAGVMAAFYKPDYSGGPDKAHWDAMRWIAENTPKNATVYTLYSQLYSQTSILYNDERPTYFLEGNEFVDTFNNFLQTGKFNRTMYVTYASDTGAGLPYRTGLFSFGQHIKDTVVGGPVDICSANYYLIDEALPDKLAQANNYIMQQFLKANMTVEYNGSSVFVLNNNNVSGDCIA